jgi:hypothetical protein
MGRAVKRGSVSDEIVSDHETCRRTESGIAPERATTGERRSIDEARPIVEIGGALFRPPAKQEEAKWILT